MARHRTLLKGIERAFKTGIYALLERVLCPSRSDLPDWGARRHRVLYLRYDRIGDMIMATGLIRAIASSHSTIELHVLASPGNRCVLEGNPHVARALVFDRRRFGSLVRTMWRLRWARYDAVVDGMLTPSGTSTLLILASGAPCRIGIAGRRNDFVFTHAVAPAPGGASAVEQAGALATAFGADSAQASWRYDLHLRRDECDRAEALWRSESGSPRLLVNVSAFTADRRWPAERYAEVVRHLRQRLPAARILVVGAPDDTAAMATAAGGAAEAVHVSPVREVFALVGGADALITPDTSLAHAAAALDVPVAVLFNHPERPWRPYGARLYPVTSSGPLLRDLLVEPVLRAVDDLLEREVRVRGAP